MSLVCIPIKAKYLPDLRRKIKAAAKKADIIEIWADYLNPSIEPWQVRKLTKKPLLIVNKGKKEGGLWKGTEKDRIALLKEFAKAEVDYIDVGIHTNAKLVSELVESKQNAKIIVSYHNFESTPSEKALLKIVEKAAGKGADIVKIATFAKKAEDNLKIVSVLSRWKKLPLIALCMGKKGKISRTLAPHFGSYISYVALDKASKSAVGQLTVHEHKTVDSLLK